MRSLAIILLAVSTTANALTPGELEACKNLEGIATTIMTARQYGTPMSSLIEKLQKPLYAGFRDIGMAMTAEAFNLPEYSSEEYRQDSIKRFADRYYLACFEQVGKK